jgi:hypothetical protein
MKRKLPPPQLPTIEEEPGKALKAPAKKTLPTTTSKEVRPEARIKLHQQKIILPEKMRFEDQQDKKSEAELGSAVEEIYAKRLKTLLDYFKAKTKLAVETSGKIVLEVKSPEDLAIILNQLPKHEEITNPEEREKECLQDRLALLLSGVNSGNLLLPFGKIKTIDSLFPFLEKLSEKYIPRHRRADFLLNIFTLIKLKIRTPMELNQILNWIPENDRQYFFDQYCEIKEITLENKFNIIPPTFPGLAIYPLINTLVVNSPSISNQMAENLDDMLPNDLVTKGLELILNNPSLQNAFFSLIVDQYQDIQMLGKFLSFLNFLNPNHANKFYNYAKDNLLRQIPSLKNIKSFDDFFQLATTAVNGDLSKLKIMFKEMTVAPNQAAVNNLKLNLIADSKLVPALKILDSSSMRCNFLSNCIDLESLKKLKTFDEETYQQIMNLLDESDQKIVEDKYAPAVSADDGFNMTNFNWDLNPNIIDLKEMCTKYGADKIIDLSKTDIDDFFSRLYKIINASEEEDPNPPKRRLLMVLKHLPEKYEQKFLHDFKRTHSELYEKTIAALDEDDREKIKQYLPSSAKTAPQPPDSKTSSKATNLKSTN